MNRKAYSCLVFVIVAVLALMNVLATPYIFYEKRTSEILWECWTFDKVSSPDLLIKYFEELYPDSEIGYQFTATETVGAYTYVGYLLVTRTYSYVEPNILIVAIAIFDIGMALPLCIGFLYTSKPKGEA